MIAILSHISVMRVAACRSVCCSVLQCVLWYFFWYTTTATWLLRIHTTTQSYACRDTSHVTHMNESCHTHEWVMSHINESCHIWPAFICGTRVMSLIWRGIWWVMSLKWSSEWWVRLIHIRETRHKRHVTDMNEWLIWIRDTRVMSLIWRSTTSFEWHDSSEYYFIWVALQKSNDKIVTSRDLKIQISRSNKKKVFTGVPLLIQHVFTGVPKFSHKIHPV